MLKSLQLKGITWTCALLGENALLLEPQTDEQLKEIYRITRYLEEVKPKQLTDIIPAYNSIALIYNHLLESPDKEISKLQEILADLRQISFTPKQHTVPLCFEFGLDWSEVEKYTNLEKEEIIHLYLKAEYSVAMVGFIPGFVYLDGMNEQLKCPRKENPRKQIPGGSVGIGGEQTGIYSLESPGGWQIIGRTPNSFFNPETYPPTKIRAGDILKFKRISEQQFHEFKTQKES